MESRNLTIKNTKSVTEALAFINQNAEEIARAFLDPAKDDKPGTPSFICPNPTCRNGTGEDGTGMKFVRNYKGELALKCFKCDLPLGNVINYVGYSLGYGPDDFKGPPFIDLLEKIGDRFNFTISKDSRAEYISKPNNVNYGQELDVNQIVNQSLIKKHTPNKDQEPKKEPIDLSKCTVEETTYMYYDLDNIPIKSKIKKEWFDENGERVKKDFIQKDEKHNCYGFKQLTNEEINLLYQRLVVEKAKNENKTLYYVEGEKDALNLLKAGQYTTTIGSGKKLEQASLEQLEGIKKIIIIPDYDATGYKSSIENFKLFKEMGIDIKVVHWPLGTKKGYDITDYLEDNQVEGKYNKDIFNDFIENKADLRTDTKALEAQLKRFTDQDHRPQTLEELYTALKTAGQLAKENIKQSEGKAKPKIPANIIAGIINNLCYCTIINYNPVQPNTNPVAIYKPDIGIYTQDNLYINTLIKTIDDECSINKAEQVKYDLKIMLNQENKIEEELRDNDIAVLANGVYNRKTMELIPFNPDFICTTKKATAFKINPKHPVYLDGWNVDKWIEEDIAQGDPDKIRLIWQMLAQCIFNNEVNKISYFLYDEQSNTGKSTMLALIKNLVGESNVGIANLEQLEDRFKPASLVGASVIMGDENNHSTYLSGYTNFKTIASGDPMSIENKGVTPTSYTFRSVIIQAMNGFPRFRNIDDGLKNRIRIIKFPTVYKGNNVNPKVKEEYVKDPKLLEYVLYKATLVQTRPIADTQENKEFLARLEVMSDDVAAFAEDVLDSLNSQVLPKPYLYQLYKAWSSTQKDTENISHNRFTSRLEPIMKQRGFVNKVARPTADTYKPGEDIDNLKPILLGMDQASKDSLKAIVQDSKNNTDKTIRCFVKE